MKRHKPNRDYIKTPMSRQDYEDYRLLAIKLAHRYSSRTGVPFDDIHSMALEGMVQAFHDYDGSSQKSGYISTIMVKRILIGIQDESRTVRLPSSRYIKDQQEGTSSSTSTSIVGYDACEEKEGYDISPLLDHINGLSERDKDIMIGWFGLGDTKLTNKELARKWKISPAAVTYTVKKVCKEMSKRFRIEDFIE